MLIRFEGETFGDWVFYGTKEKARSVFTTLQERAEADYDSKNYDPNISSITQKQSNPERSYRREKNLRKRELAIAREGLAVCYKPNSDEEIDYYQPDADEVVQLV
jgi:hypothetical protein